MEWDQEFRTRMFTVMKYPHNFKTGNNLVGIFLVNINGTHVIVKYLGHKLYT